MGLILRFLIFASGIAFDMGLDWTLNTYIYKQDPAKNLATQLSELITSIQTENPRMVLSKIVALAQDIYNGAFDVNGATIEMLKGLAKDMKQMVIQWNLIEKLYLYDLKSLHANLTAAQLDHLNKNM
jgi:hypothetical protein